MVSIIIPNYNKGKFITETINSVINQTYKDWECVIIDDNSNDNSLQIIRKQIQDDERFKLLANNQNKGGSYSRNIGLKKSKFNYIIFLDSDDILAPNCLQNRLDFILNHNKLDFAVFPMGTFYNKLGDSNLIWKKFKGNHKKRFLKHDLPWHTMMVFWHKKALYKINGFDENFIRLQDVELHTKALINGLKYKINNDSNVDAYFRINESRITINYSSFIENKVKGTIQYINNFKKVLENKNQYKEVKLLKATFFTMLSEIFHAYRNEKIDYHQKEKLIKVLFNKSLINNQFKLKDKISLTFYFFLSNKKVKIKGLNFIIKIILIS